MGSVCSRFLRNITRTQCEEDGEETDDFLQQSRDLPLTLSVQKLLAVCFNCAVFVVVGMAVKDIAGPAMILSVILGAVVAMLNNLSLTELCTRSPTSRNFYAIIYKDVGELCAFMLGWFRLLQNIFIIAIVSYAAGEYIKYIAEPYLQRVWSPGVAGWTDVNLDALVFVLGFLALLSIIVAAGLPYSAAYRILLCWLSIVVFTLMFLVVLYNANSITWRFPTEFQPYNIGGTIQGIAITTWFLSRSPLLFSSSLPTIYAQRFS